MDRAGKTWYQCGMSELATCDSPIHGLKDSVEGQPFHGQICVACTWPSTLWEEDSGAVAGSLDGWSRSGKVQDGMIGYQEVWGKAMDGPMGMSPNCVYLGVSHLCLS